MLTCGCVKRSKRKRKTREEVEQLLLDNEHTNATPAGGEQTPVRLKRQNRRRVKRFRLNAALKELTVGDGSGEEVNLLARQGVHIAATTDVTAIASAGGLDAHEEIETETSLFLHPGHVRYMVYPSDLDLEESKQEDDHPDFIIARAYAREERRLADLVEAQRHKRNEDARARRAARTPSQRAEDIVARQERNRVRRLNMTEEEVSDDRHRRALKMQRRVNMTIGIWAACGLDGGRKTGSV